MKAVKLLSSFFVTNIVIQLFTAHNIPIAQEMYIQNLWEQTFFCILTSLKIMLQQNYRTNVWRNSDV